MCKKRWKESVGKRPHTVTVYERTPGGTLYIQVWDPTLAAGKGDWRRRSLNHRDRERAIAFAHEQHAKLLQGEAELSRARVTLGRVLALYERHRTPRKGRSSQKADARLIELWTRVLGAQKDPAKITLREWEDFIDRRSTGAIDSRGNPVPVEDRKPVRDRAVEFDLKWLKWVLNWATKWMDERGRYLLSENPVRGFEIPTEKNPRRPLATKDRYEVVRAVTDTVSMQLRWNGKLETVRSHLSELLDIVEGTGRRLSAVCQLRYEDLVLDRGPHGSIRWPSDTDKTGRETLVPMAPSVRTAVNRILSERPGIGSAQLFPSPADPTEPVSRHLADRWLRKAEKLAGLEPLRGSLWHAYRRKWATERKGLPDVDVAAAGGWASPLTMKQAYQQADQEGMLEVVLGGGELREVGS